MGDVALHAACRALARQARVFPDMDLSALDHALSTETAPMSDLDRAFAHAIYDGAIRNWLSLSFLLSRCTTQPYADLEPRLRGVLLAAAAQIILLDRVPVHAATNHAVEWAKRVIRPGAGGLVNAVIRKLIPMRPDESVRSRPRYTGLRDELPTATGGAIALSEPVLPENEIDRLSIATSHSRPMLEHWLLHRPMREVRDLALHGCAQPPIILNTAHSDTRSASNLAHELAHVVRRHKPAQVFVAPDGSFAILAEHHEESIPPAPSSVNLYDADGEPIRTIALPQLHLSRISYDGQSIVVTHNDGMLLYSAIGKQIGFFRPTQFSKDKPYLYPHLIQEELVLSDGNNRSELHRYSFSSALSSGSSE